MSRPNPKQPKAVKDRKYLGYVKQAPCAVCYHHGQPDNSLYRDAHHTICGRYSQVRTADYRAIPLCQAHHQGLWGVDPQKIAIHQNKREWVRRYGKDTDFIAWTLDWVECEFGYTPKGLIKMKGAEQ